MAGNYEPFINNLYASAKKIAVPGLIGAGGLGLLGYLSSSANTSADETKAERRKRIRRSTLYPALLGLLGAAGIGVADAAANTQNGGMFSRTTRPTSLPESVGFWGGGGLGLYAGNKSVRDMVNNAAGKAVYDTENAIAGTYRAIRNPKAALTALKDAVKNTTAKQYANKLLGSGIRGTASAIRGVGTLGKAALNWKTALLSGALGFLGSNAGKAYAESDS